jgi:hypothetical protein
VLRKVHGKVTCQHHGIGEENSLAQIEHWEGTFSSRPSQQARSHPDVPAIPVAQLHIKTSGRADVQTIVPGLDYE